MVTTLQLLLPDIWVIFDSLTPHTPHSLPAKLLANKIVSKYIQNSACSNHPAIITQVNVDISLHLTNWNDLITGLSGSIPSPPFPSPLPTQQAEESHKTEDTSSLSAQNTAVAFQFTESNLHHGRLLALPSFYSNFISPITPFSNSKHCSLFISFPWHAKQCFFFRVFAPLAWSILPQLFMCHEYPYLFQVFSQFCLN